MHIVLTDAARTKLRSLTQEDQSFHRISVNRKGCAGITYKVEQVSEQSNTDEAIEIGDLTLLFDQASAMFIIGTRIDYRDDLSGRGFVFANDAFQACGCGMSFRGPAK